MKQQLVSTNQQLVLALAVVLVLCFMSCCICRSKKSSRRNVPFTTGSAVEMTRTGAKNKMGDVKDKMKGGRKKNRCVVYVVW